MQLKISEMDDDRIHVQQRLDDVTSQLDGYVSAVKELNIHTADFVGQINMLTADNSMLQDTCISNGVHVEALIEQLQQLDSLNAQLQDDIQALKQRSAAEQLPVMTDLTDTREHVPGRQDAVQPLTPLHTNLQDTSNISVELHQMHSSEHVENGVVPVRSSLMLPNSAHHSRHIVSIDIPLSDMMTVDDELVDGENLDNADITHVLRQIKQQRQAAELHIEQNLKPATNDMSTDEVSSGTPHTLKVQHDAAMADLSNAQSKLTDTTRQLDEMQHEKAALQKQLSEYKAELGDAGNRFDEVQQQLSAQASLHQRAVAQLQSQLDTATKQLNDLLEVHRHVGEQVVKDDVTATDHPSSGSELYTQLRQRESKIEQLQKHIHELEQRQQLHDEVVQRHKQQVEAVSAENASLQAHQIELVQKHEEAVLQTQEHAAGWQARAEQVKANMQQLALEHDHYKETQATVHATDMATVHRLEQQCMDVTEQLNDTQNKYTAVKAQLTDVTNEYNELQHRYTVDAHERDTNIKQLTEQYNGLRDNLNPQVNALMQANTGVQAQLNSSKQQIETMTSAHGVQLQSAESHAQQLSEHNQRLLADVASLTGQMGVLNDRNTQLQRQVQDMQCDNAMNAQRAEGTAAQWQHDVDRAA